MNGTPRLRRAVATVLPLLLVAAAFPAFGFLGLGDAAIVANQIIQIANEVAMIAEAVQTLSSLENQLDQQINKALGQVGALAETFDQLSSDPMSLLNGFTAITWGNDFTGEPRNLLQAVTEMPDPALTPLTDYWRNALAQADRVPRGRLQNLFRTIPGNRASDVWLNSRERADRARIFDYTALDTTERLAELIATASASLERSRQQTNLSDTALAQEQLSNQLTAAEINIAVAELLKQTSLRDAMDRQNLELFRLRQLEAWANTIPQQRRRVDNFRNAIRSRNAAYNDALLLN